MRTQTPRWYGTHQEAADLLEAAQHNCTCTLDTAGKRTALCGSHAMIFTEQRSLNGLLFARRMITRFRAAEFDATDDIWATPAQLRLAPGVTPA